MAEVLTSATTGKLEANVQFASDGAGGLLQRDYWAPIAECRVTPAALMADLKLRFCAFPPADLVVFSRAEPACERPMEVGDELNILIRMAGTCRVRVTCADEHSITLATLKGHPEAGRITFGSYRHESGAVIFHIRSRSRSGDRPHSVGFFAIGEAMQTNTWTDFVNTVAQTYGAGIAGELHAETSCVEATASDDRVCAPTFEAKGAD